MFNQAHRDIVLASPSAANGRYISNRSEYPRKTIRKLGVLPCPRAIFTTRKNLQQDSACLNDASEDCKKTYRVISALTSTIYNQVNQVCSPGTLHKETYMKVLPCISKHSKDFEECSGEHHMKKFDDEKLQSVCM
ncbi:hypothetical protein AVEN_192850-1 [Araneus ventricosus]|uniref:Uncharacterized protein n=1 Tax=Araneus ventricosus TaxID=182803 RepID=A0A4Y2EPF5_ARAVE|nr:hypothetical protein AVEN_192850-1 [Araneus ventricosus]